MKIYQDLFGGNLGTWTGKSYNLPTKDDVDPYHAWSFPVPKIHELTLKTKIDRLVKLVVLLKVSLSQWGAPIIIISTKDGTVRFISEFIAVKKIIRWQSYPIPK